MLLYHGSYAEIPKPDLAFSRRALDFGPGFYVTSDYDQAGRWAMRVIARRRHGKACISVYSVDDDAWRGLSVLRYDGPNREWLRTVVGYRSGLYSVDDGYDVIVGPVADDRTVDTINLYLDGSITEDMALQLLLPFRYTDQWTFRTKRALSALVYEEVLHP